MPELYREASTSVTAGGGSRIRTGDMLLAKQPLYQLSYTPDACIALVGLTRIELVTSSLSGTRSNQLSYTPGSSGGGSRIRTGDILLAKQALYQLSHAPRGGTRPALSEGRRDTDREGDAGGSRRASTSGPEGPCSSERR